MRKQENHLNFIKAVAAAVCLGLCEPLPAADAGKFWVENRIVYNAKLPHDRDGLKDDVDYFPDEYLREIAGCGMNGIWMRVDWRKIAETSLTPRTADGGRRLAKLRDIAAKCRRNGLGLWIFGNEPARFRKGDQLLAAHPELGGAFFPTHGSTMWCPSSQEVLRYIEEAVKDLFSNVPELAGFLNIAYGESLTTCLDAHECCDIDYYGSLVCRNCTAKPLWEAYVKTSEAVVRGIRAAGSSAPYISWFYQPMGTPQRKDWVFDCAGRAPEGTTFMFNFESANVEEQLGRMHCGADYWLAKTRPGAPFLKAAEAARANGARLGAKIQTGVSHELATLPYVPVPALLYRKYAEMKRLGVKDVMQGWYFGGEPGLMLKAAGMLSREDFSDGEDAFLLRLAESQWGKDAPVLAGLWKRFSDAFANYPLDTQVQYYGPYHAGIVWNLHPSPVSENLARTWRADEPPSGDRIGQCLGSFSIWEAEKLAAKMADMTGEETGGALEKLNAKYAHNAERMRDIGVMMAFRLQLASAAAVFRFYRLRAEGVHASRVRGDDAAALTAASAMCEEVKGEHLRTVQMLKLAEADLRLGFHAEAARRLYDPESLRSRLRSLEKNRHELERIRKELRKGRSWPLSPRERVAPYAGIGCGWIEAGDLRWRVDVGKNGELIFSGESAPSLEGVTLMLSDAACIRSPVRCNISRPDTGKGFYIPDFDKGFCTGEAQMLPGGRWRFRITSELSAWGRDGILRPAWVALVADTWLPMGKARTLWPVGTPKPKGLGMLWADGSILGRLLDESVK